MSCCDLKKLSFFCFFFNFKLTLQVKVESDRAEAFEKAYASAVKRNYIYGGLAVTASAIAIVALVSKPK